MLGTTCLCQVSVVLSMLQLLMVTACLKLTLVCSYHLLDSQEGSPEWASGPEPLLCKHWSRLAPYCYTKGLKAVEGKPIWHCELEPRASANTLDAEAESLGHPSPGPSATQWQGSWLQGWRCQAAASRCPQPTRAPLLSSQRGDLGAEGGTFFLYT